MQRRSQRPARRPKDVRIKDEADASKHGWELDAGVDAGVDGEVDDELDAGMDDVLVEQETPIACVTSPHQGSYLMVVPPTECREPVLSDTRRYTRTILAIYEYMHLYIITRDVSLCLWLCHCAGVTMVLGTSIPVR